MNSSKKLVCFCLIAKLLVKLGEFPVMLCVSLYGYIKVCIGTHLPHLLEKKGDNVSKLVVRC